MSKLTWLVVLIVLLIAGTVFFVFLKGDNSPNNAIGNQDNAGNSDNVATPNLENADNSDFSDIQNSDDDFNQIDNALDILE